MLFRMDLNEIKENACAIKFTEMKEYIMSFPSKTKLVNIHDTTLTRRDLECLLEDEKWRVRSAKIYKPMVILTHIKNV